MLVTLKKQADPKTVQSALQEMGLWTTPLVSRDEAVTALVVAKNSRLVEVSDIERVPGVSSVSAEPSGHPRLDERAGHSVHINSTVLGGGAAPVLMAGPCSAESEAQVHSAAEMVAAAGGKLLRAGAFKPRTSPYSFAGFGRPALGWIRDAADANGLGVVTEVMSESEVEAVGEIADLVQIGSRNMQNFALLHRVGALGRPVLLKRGMAASVHEWLMAGEHLLAAGAADVVFCERGIASFDSSTRNLLDLGAVALMKHVHNLTVIVDPSHAVGRRDLIPVLAKAALAAGADGLIVEVHPQPSQAKSDGPQALNLAELLSLKNRCFE